MTAVLLKLAVRLLVFTGVFWFATRKNKKVVVKPRWALPLVGCGFALLNVGLYWLLQPVFNLATFGSLAFLMPVVVNGVLLLATVRIFRKHQRITIAGTVATLWLAAVLSIAHGALWFGLDYLPPRL
jgi:hypothetical protein